MMRSRSMLLLLSAMTLSPLACAQTASAPAATAAKPAVANEPAVVKTLRSQGVEFMGTFETPVGLTGYAGVAGQRPLGVYVSKDGEYAVVGTLVNAKGEDVSAAKLKELVSGPMGQQAWAKVEASHWVRDGKADAPRVIYSFSDPNCPYCNKFWADARPWVDSGKVVLRHVMVGILTPPSAGKAAALLAAKDPAAALSAYERGHMEQNGKSIASGRVRPLADAGLKPLEDIPADIERKLTANHRLMASLGLQATPAMVWRDANGAVQMRTGAPPSEIPAILGPR